MNWLDFNFWFFGPLPIWILAVAVFTLAFAIFKTASQIVPIIPILKSLLKAIQEIIPALQRDTVSLNLATSEVDSELKKTRVVISELHQSIDAFLKTMQKLCWWVPGVVVNHKNE